jgi:hypothetical protein
VPDAGDPVTNRVARRVTNPVAAFLFGDLDERRVVNDNTKRLIGSIVLAAVICAGCVGFAFVSNILAEQAAEKEASSQVSTSTATPTPTPARDSEDGN